MFKELFTESSVNEAKFTKANLNKVIKSYSHAQSDFEADGFDFDDSVAFQLAQDAMYENPGMEDYIKKQSELQTLSVGLLINFRRLDV